MSIEFDELERSVIEEKLLGSDESAVNADTGSINAVMLDSLDRMNKTSVNRSYREIPAVGLKGKINRLVKRLMRRLTFWYVEPCMMQQSDYNSANNVFSAQVNSELNTMRAKVDGFEDTQDAVRQLAEDFSAMNERYEQRIAELVRANRELNNIIGQHEERLADIEKFSFITGGSSMMNSFRADDFCVSFSQSGEDAVIRYILRSLDIDAGSIRYLDLGANHAAHLSNTYSFYLSGARGVLLDANPVLAKELTEQRVGDVVINKCLSDKADMKLDFYIMNGDGLSTMDYDAAQAMIKENPNLCIEKTISVDSITINEIISRHFADKAPELLNIDIEGMELAVLKMIDFDKFRPLIIISEMIEYKNGLTIGGKNQEILDYMKSVGYEEFAFTGINSIFIDSNVRKGAEQ